MADEKEQPRGIIAGIVALFLDSKLPILFVLLAFALGAAAILLTPKEEEPQIVVPMADVFVSAPGATAEEVEKLVATPLEKLLFQIDGVEYVYSTSMRDQAVVTVRFYVNEDRERSLIKLYNKIYSNQDVIPPIVGGWVIKPVEIDDVPIVNLTLYSDQYDDHALVRIGEEVLARLNEVEDISRSEIVGGRHREIRVEPMPERMAGLSVSLMDISRALAGTDQAVTAGSYDRNNRNFTVTSDTFLLNREEVASLVVGVHAGRPVYLSDVARVTDAPEEPRGYTRLGLSRRHAEAAGQEAKTYAAVTLALSKKRGTNAVVVAQNILDRMDELKSSVLPEGVRVEVTRNYGATAKSKVNDLLQSLIFAIVTVVALLMFTLGKREALVVALAVPVSFCLALFVNMLLGYTINRVTLFALILSLGLVVDDPITNVDNIQRHILLGRRQPREATLFAVSEVLPPVIMSTLAIIVSFAPMFFITGMMGPYMSPMAANVPLTVTFSTVCALTIVPWICYHLLKNRACSIECKAENRPEGAPVWVYRLYKAAVSPFLRSRTYRWLLLLFIVGLLLASAGLALFRHVPLKMLPFDNKNEFQVVIDMPEGTPLEATDRAVAAFEDFLMGVPEVVNFVSYTGTPSPMDFNGMVRHYYLRNSPNLADIRVNFEDKKDREFQSHAIALRLRPELEKIAAAYGAVIKIVEVPPGPPVVATVVTEVYGRPDMTYPELIAGARHVEKILGTEPFVVDIDDSTEAERDRLDFVLDKEKAALHGVTSQQVAAALRTAVSGNRPATVHEEGERQPLPVTVRLGRVRRTGPAELSQIPVRAADGQMVPLAEIGRFEYAPSDQPIYHKNLKRVVFVFAEMAGRAPAEAVLDAQAKLKKDPPAPGISLDWAGEGEWHITLRVFRDLGLAFMAALFMIYLLLVVQMNSFFMPFLILLAVPLTLIGIMPGFWLMNLFFAPPVGLFDNPVFFTATSMIGMIALGGIVIRNSLVLIEFIQDSLARNLPLREAIVQSGAVRLRPIVLTAATTALGAWPITLDPIFSGLAWALIFGLFSSTLFTLLVVPVAYFALNRKRLDRGGEAA